ncbi:hypothetical protein CPter291_0433 [Collimonas pratensis]|uniref:Uncharacterized protein n=1 Tax=Collimonas pratensis TaxID=279113 RepID=A0ABN4M4Y8_9BURK|nr:hypothetical protein CPter291_0433 [Collimonas pratensis]
MKRRSAIIETSDGRMMDSAGNRPAPRGLVAAAAVDDDMHGARNQFLAVVRLRGRRAFSAALSPF